MGQPGLVASAWGWWGTILLQEELTLRWQLQDLGDVVCISLLMRIGLKDLLSKACILSLSLSLLQPHMHLQNAVSHSQKLHSGSKC